MKMWSRKAAGGGLALALVLSACGDGGGTSESDDTAAETGGTEESGAETDGGEAAGVEGTITIGWTPPDVTGVFQTATEYFEEAARQAGENGIDVQIETRSPASHTDFGDQLAIVEDFITTGVDAIAISPADTEAIKPAIQQANEADIPVIMVNLLEEQEGIDVASYVGFDNSDAAEVSGYAVLDYFGGPGVLGAGEMVDPPEDGYLDLDWWQELYADADLAEVDASGVVIEGIAGTLFSQQRLDGFNTAIEGVDGLEILAEPIAADWNREQGTAAAETFLSRFGEGELDFVYAASNEMGLGAASVAEQQGRLDTSGGETPPEDGAVAVFTNDVTPESVEAIREGRIVAETHHGFAEWGWFGTAFGVRLACGLDAPQFQDIRPRTVYTGNADDFYPDLAVPEIDWQDIVDNCQR